jgi:hypothetical protein
VGRADKAEIPSESREGTGAAPVVRAAGPEGALLRMQATAGNQAVGRWLAVGGGPRLQRREVRDAASVQGPQDWTTADRVGNTPRWRAACLANLNAVDSSQYRRIVERRDFYKWFYDYTTLTLGFTTRWPLAAWVVANGAHQVADMDETHGFANETLSLAGVELQGYMREGNQVIFDNVLPKLKRLVDGPVLKGRAAMEWDMRTLAEEQLLVQPMYSRMSQTAKDEIDYIARQKRFAGWGAWWTNEAHVPGASNIEEGDVPAFDQPDLQSIGDRWRYGMMLGNKFTKGGSGFNPATDTMPVVTDPAYTSGSEFARTSWRTNLHFVDAWLNPNRTSRGPVANLVAALGRLTPREQRELLADSSPDGWAYSIELAHWTPFVTEANVRAALPADAASAPAVTAFIARFRAESARYQAAYPMPVPFGFP